MRLGLATVAIVAVGATLLLPLASLNDASQTGTVTG
jgi:hypothetical protein